MDDRRKFPRLNLNVNVQWKKSSLSRSIDHEHLSVSQNISAGGICLILDQYAKVGDMLEMDLNLSDGAKVSLKGRVVWVEKNQIIGAKSESVYEAGVEFLDISDKDRNTITNFLFKTKKENLDQKKDS